MNISLDFSSVSGRLRVPASKSMMQRVCAAALLHNGETKVYNWGISKDDKAAISIIQNLGAVVHFSEEAMTILSKGLVVPNAKIECGESGLSARLFAPIAALSNIAVMIDGSGSLPNRPMHFFEETLTKLGVAMPNFMGHIPFVIKGPLVPRNIEVNGSLSSQFISGLLFAFAASAKEEITINVQRLASKPYIDLTLEVLALFGKNITHHNYETFEVNPQKFTVQNKVEIAIEGDWSSAAFWIAAAAINGSISLLGLNVKSTQADKILLDIVQKMGAIIQWQNDELCITAHQRYAVDADLSDAPDLFPVLSVLAATCSGTSCLKGLGRLAHKESNRAESIADLLTQLQVDFTIENDTLTIVGRKEFTAIKYNCPNDHRMAMAAALAALYSTGKTEIENAEAVGKSYPSFWNDVSAHLT